MSYRYPNSYRPDIGTLCRPDIRVQHGATSGRYRQTDDMSTCSRHYADVQIHPTVPIEPFFLNMNMLNLSTIYVRAHLFEIL